MVWAVILVVKKCWLLPRLQASQKCWRNMPKTILSIPKPVHTINPKACALHLAHCVWVFALRTTPAITEALAADPIALPAFTARAGHPISLRPDPTLPPRAWHIEEIAHG